MEFLFNMKKKQTSSELSKALDTSEGPLPFVEPSKISNKSLDIVDAFAANTNKGTVRGSNEDRVAILLNIIKPKNVVGDWPRCHIFGVFDGHGGYTCAEYLRHNLHHFILNEENFVENTPEAIIRGFQQAELSFLESAHAESRSDGQFDPSGSCALLAIFLSGPKSGENTLYIVNLGDSRAIISSRKGKISSPLSVDHKPGDPSEFARIIKAGGTVYQQQLSPELQEMLAQETGIQIPLRVAPGGLSVSRTFGDIGAKLPSLNGNPNVVIAIPDIKRLIIDDSMDFIFLACDGVYDTLSNQNVHDTIWSTARSEFRRGKNIHEVCGTCTQQVLREALVHNSMDNVTGIMVAFPAFAKALEEEQKTEAFVKSINNSISRNEVYTRSLFENFRASPKPLFLKNTSKRKIKKNQYSLLSKTVSQFPLKTSTLRIATPMSTTTKGKIINLQKITNLLGLNKKNIRKI